MASSPEKTTGTVRDGGISVPGGLAHIAFIMDGNGRWAKKRALPRSAGHAQGAITFKQIARYCRDIGIKYVTVYAFSSENWSRPEAEVKALMKLLRDYLDTAEKTAREEKICVRFIGDLSVFDEDFRKKVERLAEVSSVYPATLSIAVNYGGRNEIAAAASKLSREAPGSEITPDAISASLYTSGMPDPDLIVRTGGEKRLSNFLIWQSAYAELYFTDVLWPDMTKEDVDAAVAEFSRRQRRFGGLGDPRGTDGNR
ncbi:MAG: di-trans,poly-cis-decaprenylcistransferase [Clostridia bacterium]|nr:di-trans,poly-cis-decaprenylcistransferase [Clostridia bacterium]